LAEKLGRELAEKLVEEWVVELLEVCFLGEWVVELLEVCFLLLLSKQHQYASI